MKLVYPAVFYAHELDSGYTVEIPDLPGCITQGETLAESLEMAIDAASGWILSSIESNEDVPPPSKNLLLEDYEDASFINLIMLDMEEYAKQYGEKAIKKTLTIPRWLNTLAEKANINFSQVLQKALKRELNLELNSYSIGTQECIDNLSFVLNAIKKFEEISNSDTISTIAEVKTQRAKIVSLDRYQKVMN